MLSEDDIQRYGRQIILPEVGGEGQSKIAKARVLCVGVGGLGSPAALYLAAAGVGTLGLIDDDPVDLSNLHRQILHFTTDVGRPKVLSAKSKLHSLNPSIAINVHRERLTAANALELFAGYDLVLDGSDNFPTRYLINDACFFTGRPLVSGAVLQFSGQVTTILPKKGHCYRCLFPEPPAAEAVQNCAAAGILGTAAGVVGSLQANEALKLILGLPGVLTNRLLTMDLLNNTFRTISFSRDPGCALCGSNPSVTALADYPAFCGAAGAGAASRREASMG